MEEGLQSGRPGLELDNAAQSKKKNVDVLTGGTGGTCPPPFCKVCM